MSSVKHIFKGQLLVGCEGRAKGPILLGAGDGRMISIFPR